MKVLDVRPRAIGMDEIARPAVDGVHDLERTPWPSADGEFKVVHASIVLESTRVGVAKALAGRGMGE